jgi:hypothetical protein
MSQAFIIDRLQLPTNEKALGYGPPEPVLGNDPRLSVATRAHIAVVFRAARRV